MNEIILYDDSYGSTILTKRISDRFKKEKVLYFCDDIFYPLSMRNRYSEVLNKRSVEFIKKNPKLIIFSNYGKIIVEPKTENKKIDVDFSKFRNMTVLGGHNNIQGFIDYVDAQLLINQLHEFQNFYVIRELIKEYLGQSQDMVFLNDMNLCMFRKHFEELKGDKKIYYLEDVIFEIVEKLLENRQWNLNIPGKIIYRVTDSRIKFYETIEKFVDYKVYPLLYKTKEE